MVTVIALSVTLPALAAAVYLARRHRPTLRAADVRGVALQTVIVIVVLLAIAGAVAGVLLTRGGEAVAEAERQDITRDPADFKNERLCEAYGFTWSAAKYLYVVVSLALDLGGATSQNSSWNTVASAASAPERQ